jgi:hypothetical protein
MRPDVQIILSGCLTFGVPLLIALRELVMLRRNNRPGRPFEPPKPPEPKPLPSCLIEAARAKRREPELV